MSIRIEKSESVPVDLTQAGNAFQDNPFRRKLAKVFAMLDTDSNGDVSMREFVWALPWLYRKYPILARHFKKMDVDSSGDLSFDEFLNFAASKRAVEEMRRDNQGLVYDITFTEKFDEKGLHRQKRMIRRNEMDPALKCELVSSCKDIHKEGHRFVWNVEDVKAIQQRTPGQHYIQSKTFRAAGSHAFLRLWPNGYFCKWYNLNDFPGWATIGFFPPRDTRLKFRFFVNNTYSDWRDVYFNQITSREGLWSIPGDVPENASCGVEIAANYSDNFTRAKSLWRRRFLDESTQPYFEPEPFHPEDHQERMKREKFLLKHVTHTTKLLPKIKRC